MEDRTPPAAGRIGRPPAYAMGHSQAERNRLGLQDELLSPHSENLMRQAGVSQGMRALDVGCGIGESTVHLARVVGPRGHVVAIDQDAQALLQARQLLEDLGLRNVSFLCQTLPELQLDEPVDAIFGRFVLMHVTDQDRFVSTLLPHVAPGGVVTFQEFTVSRGRSVPEVETMLRWQRWNLAALRRAGADPDVGERLPSIFAAAGLPQPAVAAVSIGGGAESLIPRCWAQSVRSLAPLIIAGGDARPDELEEPRLVAELTEATRQAGATLYNQDLVAAWSSP